MRTEFVDWLVKVPAANVVWIAGNHDFACQQPGFKIGTAQQITDAVAEAGGPRVEYLMDESAFVDGLEIYGTPWVPNLQNWAFYATDEAFQVIGDDYPDTADILLLHGPPKGVLDGTSRWGHVGAPHILQAIDRVRPKLVICGHIHEGYGHERHQELDFYNVAHMDEFYNPVNDPVVFVL